jgi:AbrB family looped-hinge helix DNA binding protein
VPLARITCKGQITVPKVVRERLGVEPGDALDFRFEGEHLEVRPVRRWRLAEFRGMFPIPTALDHAEERARAWAARGRELEPGRPQRHA